MQHRLTRTLLALAAAAALAAGCGQSPAAFSTAGPAAGIEAQSTRSLMASFYHIHMAVFTRLDANEDESIDEYEAGPGIDLRAFAQADKNRNGRLTKKEFMDFATAGRLFGFMHLGKEAFMHQTRQALAGAFGRLDRDRNRLLTASELNAAALKKVGVNLRIDALGVRVVITESDEALFTGADKTEDKALSQAEFEDYCMRAFIGMINPKYDPGKDLPAPVAPDEPEEPAPDA